MGITGYQSFQSLAKKDMEMPICLQLERQAAARALRRAEARAGRRMATSRAMTAMTTRRSMSVKARGAARWAMRVRGVGAMGYLWGPRGYAAGGGEGGRGALSV